MYNEVYAHAKILFSLKKEGNPGICENMDESEEPYAKWNKARHRKTNTTCSHLYRESKIIKLTEAENRIVATEAEGGENGETMVKGCKISASGNTFSFWNLLHSVINIVNKRVSHMFQNC